MHSIGRGGGGGGGGGVGGGGVLRRGGLVSATEKGVQNLMGL